jgi:predicted permease
MLRKNLSFTVVAVLALALGIGANTAIFSLLDAVLLKMLPVQNPEQLVVVNTVGPKDSSNDYSYPVFERFRDQNQSLSGIFAATNTRKLSIKVNVPGTSGETESVEGKLVSGGYFSVLGVKPITGHAFTAEEDRVPGGHPVAVISYGYWQRRFGRNPAAVGQTFTLNDTSFTIIGVTPPEFFGETVGDAPDLWIPTMMQSQVYPGRNFLNVRYVTWLRLVARLKPGVRLQQAQADLNVIFQQLQGEVDTSKLLPKQRQEFLAQRIELTPGSKGLSELRKRFSGPLRILMAVVGLVLLIACANVANLLLARAVARQKEMAVRLALGASRLRLVRQLLTESVLLSLLGGLSGLLLASWGSDVLLVLVSSGTFPIFLDLHLDTRILAFTSAVSLLTGILFGLAPALRSTRVDLTPALKDSARSLSGSRVHHGLGKMLIVTQVALSLLLLIGAGLFLRSLRNLKSLDAGFNRENVLVLNIDGGVLGYKEAQLKNLYRQLLERINTLPGVHSASFAYQIFRGGGSGICCISIQGAPPLPEEDRRVNANYVGPKFFETMGTPLLAGRDFDLQDNENAQQVAVINEAAARYYFPNESPIGKRFDWWVNKGIEIVGVVKEAKQFGLREPAPRMFYLPLFQHGGPNFLAVRTVGNPTGMIAAVRHAVQAVDPKLPIVRVTTLAALVDASLVQDRLVATLSSFFGLLALLLACVGLYGVMSYTVSRRTTEIGIRVALGARPRDVLKLVIRQGMVLTLIGVAIGLAAASALTRLMSSLLYGVSATDPVTFVGASVMFATVALLASYIPARRATKVDPMVALRYE